MFTVAAEKLVSTHQTMVRFGEMNMRLNKADYQPKLYSWFANTAAVNIHLYLFLQLYNIKIKTNGDCTKWTLCCSSFSKNCKFLKMILKEFHYWWSTRPELIFGYSHLIFHIFCLSSFFSVNTNVFEKSLHFIFLKSELTFHLQCPHNSWIIKTKLMSWQLEIMWPL